MSIEILWNLLRNWTENILKKKRKSLQRASGICDDIYAEHDLDVDKKSFEARELFMTPLKSML